MYFFFLSFCLFACDMTSVPKPFCGFMFHAACTLSVKTFGQSKFSDILTGMVEREKQDATNLMFIIKLLSQHVWGIIMPIIRRTRVFTAAYGVLLWL